MTTPSNLSTDVMIGSGGGAVRLDVSQWIGVTRRLCDVVNECAKNVVYGRQRPVGIALALAAKPCVLFLDGPGAGVRQP